MLKDVKKHKNITNDKYLLLNKIIRIVVSFKKSIDSLYLEEITEIKLNNKKCMFITTNEIMNIKYCLQKINFINIYICLPIYIYLYNFIKL